MSNAKIQRIKKRIMTLEKRIKKDQQSLREEKNSLKIEVDKNKVKKVDELLLHFNDLNIDITLDELVNRLKNNDLNLKNKLKSNMNLKNKNNQS